MARIVLGIATAHSPMLSLSSEQWIKRSEVDYVNPRLCLSDGQTMVYSQLRELAGDSYLGQLDPALMKRREIACRDAIERLADALHAANPDVVVIIGDDQAELFGPTNQPTLAIFHGDTALTYASKRYASTAEDWMRQVGRGCLMDDVYAISGHPDFGVELIERMVDLHADVASVASVTDATKAGFGHAYGFIVHRLFRGKQIPIIPVMLNTYFAPNVPSAARSFELGQKLREAIKTSKQNLRVAVVGSGGLSHFVLDEALDRSVLKAIAEKDSETLSKLPRKSMRSGTSEILNWVMTAGCMEEMKVDWQEYHPLYRTEAGTGVGAGFNVWTEKIPD
jgi:hypothetical protein